MPVEAIKITSERGIARRNPGRRSAGSLGIERGDCQSRVRDLHPATTGLRSDREPATLGLGRRGCQGLLSHRHATDARRSARGRKSCDRNEALTKLPARDSPFTLSRIRESRGVSRRQRCVSTTSCQFVGCRPPLAGARLGSLDGRPLSTVPMTFDRRMNRPRRRIEPRADAGVSAFKPR